MCFCLYDFARYAAMERFDRLYLEAALDLGAGHWRTLFSVLLPLTLPGVASGVMIVLFRRWALF